MATAPAASGTGYPADCVFLRASKASEESRLKDAHHKTAGPEEESHPCLERGSAAPRYLRTGQRGIHPKPTAQHRVSMSHCSASGTRPPLFEGLLQQPGVIRESGAFATSPASTSLVPISILKKSLSQLGHTVYKLADAITKRFATTGEAEGFMCYSFALQK